MTGSEAWACAEGGYCVQVLWIKSCVSWQAVRAKPSKRCPSYGMHIQLAHGPCYGCSRNLDIKARSASSGGRPGTGFWNTRSLCCLACTIFQKKFCKRQYANTPIPDHPCIQHGPWKQGEEAQSVSPGCRGSSAGVQVCGRSTTRNICPLVKDDAVEGAREVATRLVATCFFKVPKEADFCPEAQV